MKWVLPEWYGHNDETLGQILKTGTIALDTNALLDLYRVGKQQRTEILGALTAVRGRLFIPYQVALEFHRNRLNVVRDNSAIYDKLAAGFELKQDALDGIRDPRLRAEVQTLFTEVSEKFKRGLEGLRTEHALTVEVATKSDPVLDALDHLLTTHSVGARPTDEVLKERRAKATERIDRKIPPGFADAKGKEDPSGDYLIWAELLEHAGATSRPLMFVSNDETKGDWYRTKISGRSLGPLPDLVAEMRNVLPNDPYHQTNLASFMALAKEHLGLSVGEETIDSLQRIEVSRVSDPARNPFRDQRNPFRDQRNPFRDQRNPFRDDVEYAEFVKNRQRTKGEMLRLLELLDDASAAGDSEVEQRVAKLIADKVRNNEFQTPSEILQWDNGRLRIALDAIDRAQAESNDDADDGWTST